MQVNGSLVRDKEMWEKKLEEAGMSSERESSRLKEKSARIRDLEVRRPAPFFLSLSLSPISWLCEADPLEPWHRTK